MKNIFIISLNIFFNVLHLDQKYFKNKYIYFNNKYNIVHEYLDQNIPLNERLSYGFKNAYISGLISFLICFIIQSIINYFFFNEYLYPLKYNIHINTINFRNNIYKDKNITEKNYKKYIKKTNVENLSILPSGMVPPNPSELLNSEANKKLIELLEKEYDYIIFDCVPINGLPDSLIMANLVDKVLIVCAANTTPTDLIQKTKASLENVEANIAGVIINKTKASYNKYYGHYYGKYYG